LRQEDHKFKEQPGLHIELETGLYGETMPQKNKTSKQSQKKKKLKLVLVEKDAIFAIFSLI
jgi:hypothetical protein